MTVRTARFATALIYTILLTIGHLQVEAANETTASATPQTVLERIRKGPEHLGGLDYIWMFCLVSLGFELMAYVSYSTGRFDKKRIPVRGKHLDELSAADLTYISINKLSATPFMYALFRYAYHAPNIHWQLEQISLLNTVVALAAIFIIYDFFYTLLHWALHIQGIYKYIHKHHHHQKAPSRGNTDAVNVHPIEYHLGEYNHLLAVALVQKYVVDIHVVTLLILLAIGGYMASVNHTRFDVTLLGGIYDSKVHDVHHRIPQCNYGQYTMIWDKIFGTFREYNPNDRINPASQLDPTTGKSIGSGRNSVAVKKVE